MRTYEINKLLESLRNEGLEADELMFLAEYRLRFEEDRLHSSTVAIRYFQRRKNRLMKERYRIGFNVDKSSTRKLVGYLG